MNIAGSEGEDGHYDYVIVGGGTAGCVVAARLSERSDLRVLLLEAGVDMQRGDAPAATLDTYPSNYDDPAYRWPGIVGHHLDAQSSPQRRLHQARVMGGGSTIMGMMALRGTPEDYAEWVEHGAAGWSWSDVLPYFRKVERDADQCGPMHGDCGPVTVRRAPVAGWSSLGKAAGDYADRTGMQWISDLNGDFGDGFGPIPRFASIDRRQSSALCYLTPNVRSRRNLDVIANATVTSIEFEGSRATGVTAKVNEGHRRISCRELILSAGALLTPELLLRHGFGPARELLDLGIKVREDLPVGCNLQNHAMLSFVALCRAPGVTEASERAFAHGMFRISTDLEPAGRSSLAITSGGAAGEHGIARHMANFSLLLMKPESRGRITLTRTGHDRLIEYRLLDAKQDSRRLAAGCEWVASFLNSTQMQALVRGPRLVTRWARVGRMNSPGFLSMALSRIAGVAATTGPWLGDALLDLIGRRLGDLDSVEDLLGEAIAPAGHHSGTCRMGPREAGCVVDPTGRLYGAANVRVIDASVMPTLPRANTNLPVLMLAEKLSDAILLSRGYRA